MIGTLIFGVMVLLAIIGILVLVKRMVDAGQPHHDDDLHVEGDDK